MITQDKFFDAEFKLNEQLPRTFTVAFNSVTTDSGARTKIFVNDVQAGDVINDNSRDNDGYRFHDVFHYTFAAMLGWSPCTRSLIKRKRKSNPDIDEFEDGARATITEEAISLMVFNKAKRNNFFHTKSKLSKSLLKQIKEMTAPFEVSTRSEKEWEHAILKGYALFRDLLNHNGGKIHFNLYYRTAEFKA